VSVLQGYEKITGVLPPSQLYFQTGYVFISCLKWGSEWGYSDSSHGTV